MAKSVLAPSPFRYRTPKSDRLPGKLNYGSFGAGTLSHLAGEIMQRDMGVDIVHVPYKGAAEVTKGLLAGEVQMVFDGPTSAISNVKTGRVKLIAAAGEKRVAALPDLPTLREQGFAMAVDGWISFFGPAGMSPALVNTVYQHLARAIALPEIQKLMANAGNEPGGMPPAEFTALVHTHYADRTVPDFRSQLDHGVRGVRIGVPRHFFAGHPNLTSDVLNGIGNTISVLREAGAHVEDVELPEQKLFAACARVIMTSEM